MELLVHAEIAICERLSIMMIGLSYCVIEKGGNRFLVSEMRVEGSARVSQLLGHGEGLIGISCATEFVECNTFVVQASAFFEFNSIALS